MTANFCIPKVDTLPPETKKAWEDAHKKFMDSSAGNFFNDMYLSSNAIFASFGMSLIYCFIFMAIMSYFAECLSWFIVVLIQLSLIAAPIGLFLLRQKNQKTHDEEKGKVIGGNV